MKLIILIFTMPYFIISKALLLCKYDSIVNDYIKCCIFIESQKNVESVISDELYNKLILAEDHRNSLHYGIDPFSIFRCLYLRVLKKIMQGGSTIEQQLVRTITGRYERMLRRKLREQILAVLILNKFKNKKLIGKVYINNAYYGYGKVSLSSLSDDEKIDTSELIARLKYPTKKDQLPIDNSMIQIRKKYINLLFKNQFK